MEKLHVMRAKIRAIGRCALVGTLAGLLTTQAFASGLNGAVRNPDQPTGAGVMMARPSEPALAVNPNPFSSTSAELSALPSAPEAGKAEPPASPDPMIAPLAAAAAGDGQALTSAPKSSDKKIQRPGMLVMAIAGLPLVAMGAYLYSYPSNNTKAKAMYGSIFMVPGAAMSGLGFYFAFHKRN